MARADFSKSTKLDLGVRVNFKCVYPGCDRVTHGPTISGDRVISIGVAAHDVAASAGGPRGDATLTPEQIRAYENGAWLCATDATLVDRDPRSFPVGTLPAWQQAAELRASKAMYIAPISTHASTQEVCSRLSAFLREARKVRITLYSIGRENTSFSRESIREIWSFVDNCSGPMWKPTHPLHSLHPHTVSIQNGAIEALRGIYEEVTDRNRWELDEYGHQYQLRRLVSPFRNSITDEQRTGVDFVYSCFERYQRHIDELRIYERGEGHTVYSNF
ncbi:hypothetical protein D3C78_526400 [compost metagenome]